ncbi:nitrate ABC transporter ATPase [Leuconostoc fallax]|uniref:nitrate ABC transporter ATPase n=1 Tax=Leuconostoc fallax TaxID=1251 RepID=UPI002090E981|nr:nitrate ABC transporter ATPase [Leuconostoc fallax]MCO6183229.1 nitrate ABC transporter ATPase [Leuconostoc fallax]
MTPNIQKLLDTVNEIYPGTVMVRDSGPASGRLLVDRIHQSVLGERLLIELEDSTAADFQIGNELLQMLLTLNNIMPQVFFALSFDDEGLDDQLIQIATRLHHVVLHAITYQELAKKGILTRETATAYLAGIQDSLTPENGELDDESLWRLLTLLDALVFAQFVPEKDFLTTLQTTYPIVYTAAKQLVEPILQADVTSSRQLRRQVVQLFTHVDEVLAKWGKPTINANEFVTVTSVLSKRQLNQEVRQVFDIFHSEMLDFQTKKTAYVGLNKTDRQNSFVLTFSDDESQKPAFFKEIYAMTVEALFKKLALPYIER